jgi:hypothetical protein
MVVVFGIQRITSLRWGQLFGKVSFLLISETSFDHSKASETEREGYRSFLDPFEVGLQSLDVPLICLAPQSSWPRWGCSGLILPKDSIPSGC